MAFIWGGSMHLLLLAVAIYLGWRFKRVLGRFWLERVSPLSQRVDQVARGLQEAPMGDLGGAPTPLTAKDAEEMRK